MPDRGRLAEFAARGSNKYKKLKINKLRSSGNFIAFRNNNGEGEIAAVGEAHR